MDKLLFWVCRKLRLLWVLSGLCCIQNTPDSMTNNHPHPVVLLKLLQVWPGLIQVDSFSRQFSWDGRSEVLRLSWQGWGVRKPNPLLPGVVCAGLLYLTTETVWGDGDTSSKNLHSDFCHILLAKIRHKEQSRFKGWEKRLYFSMRGVAKYYSHFFQCTKNRLLPK